MDLVLVEERRQVYEHGAAGVIGANGGKDSNEEEDDRRIPITLRSSQRSSKYALLDQKAASYPSLIQDYASD
ncbi:hypothetical protein SLE2022_276160 [Rubroshorea leprosula]